MTPSPSVRSSSLAVSGAALLATVVAAGSLRLLVQGDAWWWASLFVATLAVAASAGTRRVRRIRALAPVAGTLTAAVVVLLIWVPGTLAWLILPTDDTISAIAGLLRAATRQIYLDTAPATATPGLQLLIAFGVAILAVLVDALAAELRLPWLAGLPLLLLAIVPARAVGLGDDLGGVTATAAAFLLLVWVDRRRDVSRPPASTTAALGATAVIGALILQALVPTLVNPAPASAGTLRPVFAPGADPLVRLGEQLRRGADVTVLTYKTTASTPVYLRVVTIDNLDGDEWAPTTSDGDPSSRQVLSFPSPQGLSGQVGREKVSTVIKDAFQHRAWLPVPYPATSVDGLVGEWAWEPDALTVQAVGPVRPVDEYTVSSLQTDPTVEQLRAAPPSAGSAFDRYLALPQGLPSNIPDTAAAVTADATTAYDKAVALQSYLRGRDFTYDEETPQRADGDGDSMDVISAFLDAKRGYCVHFASAMTVMARTLGIPARIAVGYQPGERLINQPGVFEVTSHDLHAWPELYFEGAGWTRFEPTPGRGDVPRYREDAQAGQTDPSTAPTPTPSASARQDRAAEEAAAGGGGSSGGPPIGGAAIGAGVLVLLGAPALARALRRRRRLASLRVPRAGPAWDELHDTALDLGILQGGAETPRALAARLEEVLSPSPDEDAELHRLLAVVERERFARPGTTGEPADEHTVRSLLRRMRASRGRAARLRATFLPTSLVAWALSMRRPEVPATVR